MSIKKYIPVITAVPIVASIAVAIKEHLKQKETNQKLKELEKAYSEMDNAVRAMKTEMEKMRIDAGLFAVESEVYKNILKEEWREKGMAPEEINANIVTANLAANLTGIYWIANPSKNEEA